MMKAWLSWARMPALQTSLGPADPGGGSRMQPPAPHPPLFEGCPFTTALSTEGFRHKLYFKFNIGH